MQTLQKALFIAAVITFIIVIGGAVYEHLVSVPVWKRSPPRSLAMFNGPYAMAPDKFWKLVHPVCLLFMIGALIACWRTESRSALLITFSGYALVLVITAVYFVPELLKITHTPFSDLADADLTRRAGLWETRSLIRLAFLLVLASVLVSGTFKLTTPAVSAYNVRKDSSPYVAAQEPPMDLLIKRIQ